jgi:hypothetical protein
MNARGNSQSRALAIHPPVRTALTPAVWRAEAPSIETSPTMSRWRSFNWPSMQSRACRPSPFSFASAARVSLTLSMEMSAREPQRRRASTNLFRAIAEIHGRVDSQEELLDHVFRIADGQSGARNPSPHQDAQGRYRSPKSAVGNGVAGDRGMQPDRPFLFSCRNSHALLCLSLTVLVFLLLASRSRSCVFLARDFQERRLIPPLPPPKNPS